MVFFVLFDPFALQMAGERDLVVSCLMSLFCVYTYKILYTCYISMYFIHIFTFYQRKFK